MMNTYIIKEKARLIRKAQEDFYTDFGLRHTPFTRKTFFYFFELNGAKYVHKESLRFVYTNANTWTNNSDPSMCSLYKEFKVPEVLSFLSNNDSSLLPAILEETENFIVFDYIPGKPVDSISKEEYNYIKGENEKMSLTPFYNSMAYNLLRADKLYLIDLKHFEYKKDIPFFIYFYNFDFGINKLYTDVDVDINLINGILDVDYPFAESDIIYY